PVLARILKERNLLSTKLASVAVSCAAVDDASGWLLLAIITSMVHSAENWLHLAITMSYLLGFIVIMLVPVRQVLIFLEGRHPKGNAGGGIFFGLILFMLASSWTTEKLGVHPLFGSFLAGLVVPKNQGLATKTIERIESLTLAVLLPLFFALTGLRTRIDLLLGGRFWALAAAIIALAIFGKLAGAVAGACLAGTPFKASLALGILMNTRGLVELVVLNVGLELGILSPALFTMMVIMALVTTFMTTPLLDLLKITNEEIRFRKFHMAVIPAVGKPPL
ncbi:MAG TPA: cation:proton antiporter, partial [Candidatus Angelobacter sp.]